MRNIFFDFDFFLELQLADAVIHLYDGFRLNKQRGARRRLIMNHSAEMTAVFLLHRDDIPVIADRDQVVLQHFLNRGGTHHLLQTLTRLRFAAPQLMTDPRQLRTCAIDHVRILVDTLADAVFHRLMIG